MNLWVWFQAQKGGFACIFDLQTRVDLQSQIKHHKVCISAPNTVLAKLIMFSSSQAGLLVRILIPPITHVAHT